MANPKIQLRHDTAANWTSVNPVLLEGEVGIETDTKKFKVGDGTTNWTSLAYGNADTEAIGQLEQEYNSLVDKVDELGNSIPEPNLFTTPLGNSLFNITNISDLPVGETIINTSCTTKSTNQPMFGIYQDRSRLWYVGINPGTTNSFRVGFAGTTFVTVGKTYKVKIILNKISNTEIYAKGILYNLDNTTVLLESNFDNVSSGTKFSYGGYDTLNSNWISLAYDNSTLKVNESGQLYADVSSEAPSNMVTTDTEQTITGAKTINALTVKQYQDKCLVLESNGTDISNVPFIRYNFPGAGEGTLLLGTYFDLLGGFCLSLNSATPIIRNTSQGNYQLYDTNMNDTLAGLSMPSNKYTDLTLGASGATYTAPANGWFYIKKVSEIVGHYLNIGTGEVYESLIAAWEVSELTCLYPVMKNQVISINYTATGETRLFRFIYAEGVKDD